MKTQIHDSTLSTFEKRISEAHLRLKRITRVYFPLDENKWSSNEILGHLIDSAINNYRRFIISYNEDTLQFTGYEQEKWVKHQMYNTRTWDELVLLWKMVNNHIAKLLSNIPQAFLSKIQLNHNLDEVGFRPFNQNIGASLHSFILDYLDHIDHHILQIESMKSLSNRE